MLNNRANGLGGGIAMSMSKATIQAKSDVSNNTSLQRGGGIYLNGINNLGERLTIDDSTVTGNTATDKGGGICAEWLGAGNVNVAVLTKTKVDNNRAINGGAGGYYNGTTTSMDNQSSVSFNKSGDRNGLGIVAGAQGKLTAVGTKVQGNQYFPPPGVGGGGGGGGPGSAFADDGQASAVYVELGAEVILSGCEITGNDGHGVVGFVTSLGYNIVDNSITSSAGWIGSDTVT